MPYQAHVEHYFVTETLPDKRKQTGFRVEEVKYFQIVEENLYIDYRKTIKSGYNNSWAAKQYCDGWNDCLNALSVKEESA